MKSSEIIPHHLRGASRIRFTGILLFVVAVFHHVICAQVDDVPVTYGSLAFPDSIELSLGNPLSVAADSFRLQLLELSIEEARIQADQSDFWHRLLPQIQLAASFGVRDIVFLSPTGGVPSVLPKDSYRLSMSISFSDILDFPKHDAALLRLERLQSQYQMELDRQSHALALHRRRLAELRDLLSSLKEEIRLKEDVARFNDLRFRQGKITYDVFVRSQIDLLALRRSLIRVNGEIGNLQLSSEHLR